MSVLYFAYGSNMDAEQMKERISASEYVGVGYLPDHELVFNRKGSYRPGGVASIVAKEGSTAYGVVWRMPSKVLPQLDQIEDPAAYERTEKTVHMLDGEKFESYVYVSFPQGDIDADPEYLEVIISAAEKINLPTSYIDDLKRHRR